MIALASVPFDGEIKREAAALRIDFKQSMDTRVAQEARADAALSRTDGRRVYRVTGRPDAGAEPQVARAQLGAKGV
jgi:hypothetical protein